MWSAEGDIPKEVRPGLDIDDWPFLQQQKKEFLQKKVLCLPKKVSLHPRWWIDIPKGPDIDDWLLKKMGNEEQIPNPKI